MLECCEYANFNALIGATIRCLGDKDPCVTIQAWNRNVIFMADGMIPIGHAPGAE